MVIRSHNDFWVFKNSSDVLRRYKDKDRYDKQGKTLITIPFAANPLNLEVNPQKYEEKDIN